MKKTILLVTSMVLATLLHAQSPTLTPAMNYAIGDKQITLGADTAGIMEGLAGTNKAWDFSKLMQDSAKDSTFIKYVNPAATLYKASFTNANIAAEDSSTGLTYIFYSMTNSGIEEVGTAEYNAQTKSSGLTKYTSPISLFAYPMKYGYTHTGTYVGSPGGNSITFYNGKLMTNADAYGTMKIRNIFYDSVLRVHTIKNEKDSASLGGFASIVFYDSISSFTFYTPGKKSPILTITYTETTQDPSKPSPISKTVTFNDFEHTSAIAPIQALNISFNLFPNPVNGTVNLSVSALHYSKINLNITNELGQVVKILNDIALEPGIQSLKIDLKGMPTGIYFVNALSGGQVCAQKLVVD